MNGCPPVIACRPSEGIHAFAEAAYRCDCGELPNVDDHAAIVQAARRLIVYLRAGQLRLLHRDNGLMAHAQNLADLLPPLDEARG